MNWILTQLDHLLVTYSPLISHIFPQLNTNVLQCFVVLFSDVDECLIMVYHRMRLINIFVNTLLLGIHFISPLISHIFPKLNTCFMIFCILCVFRR